MSFIVGELAAPVYGDSKPFERAMGDVKRIGEGAVKNIQNKFNELGSSLTNFGSKYSMRVTAPILGAGAASFKMGKDFEKSLSEVVGLVGVAQNQVDEWGQDILEMAPKLGKAPQELAKGLYFVTSAGMRGAQAMDVLEISAKASAAGLGETATVADLLTSAINAYGQETIDAAQAADILTASVREGKADAAALAGSMGAVLPIAAEMGVTFDQVGAATAAMTRTGTDANQAATQLRAVMTGLLKPSQQAEEALYSMGTSSADLRKQIKEEGLLSALMNIRELTNKYGDDVMAHVFPNVRALVGVLDMMGENAEENAKIFESLEDSTGSLGHAFETASETGGFKWQQTLSQLQATALGFYDTIKDAVVPIMERFTEGLASVSEWFAKLDPGMQQTLFQVGALVAAIGPAALIAGALAKVFAVLAGVFAFLVSPIGLVVAAVAGLVAAFVHLWRTNEEFRDKVLDIWEKVKAFGLAIFEILKESVLKMVEDIKPAWESLKKGFESLMPVLEFLGAVFFAVFSVVLAVVTGVINGVIRAVGPLIEAFGGLLQFIGGVVSAIVRLFTGDFKGAWESLLEAGEGIITFFRGLLNTVLGLVSGLVDGIIGFFRNLFRTIIGNSIIPDLVNGIIRWIGRLPGEALKSLRKMASNMISAVVGLPGRMLSIGRNIASSLAKGVKSAANKAISTAKKLARNVASSVQKLFRIGSPSRLFAEMGEALPEGLSRGIEGNLRKVASAASHMAERALPDLSPGLAVAGGATLTVKHSVDLRNLPDGIEQGPLEQLLEDMLNKSHIQRKLDRVSYINGQRLRGQGRYDYNL